MLSANEIYHTHERLRVFNTECGKNLKLIDSLIPNKAYGHDGIPIRILTLCNSTVTKLIFKKYIFQNYLKQGVFLDYR